MLLRMCMSTAAYSSTPPTAPVTHHHKVLELIVKSHADTTASQYPPTIHTDVTRVVHQWVAARPPPPHAACALLEVLVQHAEVLVQHITNTGSDQRNSSSSRESSSNSSRVVELLCAVLHVMETLVHLDDACRAAAVGLPAVNAADSAPTHQYISINTPHIHTSSSSPAPPPPPLPTLDPCCVSLVLQLLQQHATASSYLVHAALGVLHALLGAARDRGCTSLCARVLEAGMWCVHMLTMLSTALSNHTHGNGKYHKPYKRIQCSLAVYKCTRLYAHLCAHLHTARCPA